MLSRVHNSQKNYTFISWPCCKILNVHSYSSFFVPYVCWSGSSCFMLFQVRRKLNVSDFLERCTLDLSMVPTDLFPLPLWQIEIFQIQFISICHGCKQILKLSDKKKSFTRKILQANNNIKHFDLLEILLFLKKVSLLYNFETVIGNFFFVLMAFNHST